MNGRKFEKEFSIETVHDTEGFESVLAENLPVDAHYIESLAKALEETEILDQLDFSTAKLGGPRLSLAYVRLLRAS
jgi:hypothetical protein